MKFIWCSSPFHIITAINMKEKLFADAALSIILTDYSATSEHYYEILRNDNRFDKIFYVPSKKILSRFEKGSVIYRLYYFLHANSYLKTNEINLQETDEIIFPYRDQIVKAIALCSRKKGMQIRFSYYDDGAGSYCGSAIASNPSRLELALGIPIRLFIPDNIYLYCPTLCLNYNQLRVKPLPVIDNIEFYKNYMNQDVGSYEKKVVLLDQDQYGVSKLLKDWSEKIAVKKHPKRTDMEYENAGFQYIWRDEQPFELSIMNDTHVEDKVFISVFSTACMTPKMLFNKEPTVIFLIELINIDDIRNSEEIKNLIYRFRENYSDKHKVYIPKTKDELRKTLNEVL